MKYTEAIEALAALPDELKEQLAGAMPEGALEAITAYKSNETYNAGYSKATEALTGKVDSFEAEVSRLKSALTEAQAAKDSADGGARATIEALQSSVDELTAKNSDLTNTLEGNRRSGRIAEIVGKLGFVDDAARTLGQMAIEKELGGLDIWDEQLCAPVIDKFVNGAGQRLIMAEGTGGTGGAPMQRPAGSAHSDNPFDKSSPAFNMTKQAELFKTDPAKAATLQAAAEG